jgi:hypothetical protein
MSTNIPSPILGYQGSALTLQHVDMRLGVSPLLQAGPTSLGLDFAELRGDGAAPRFRLRPTQKPVAASDPCTLSFNLHYQQNGVQADMVFALASDEQGGVLGTAMSIEVYSNYPDIDMSMGKFVFHQKGAGVLQRKVLPADYVASMTVRFWLQDADPALDGQARIEVGYVDRWSTHLLSDARGAAVPVVTVGQAALLPALDRKDARVLGVRG